MAAGLEALDAANVPVAPVVDATASSCGADPEFIGITGSIANTSGKPLLAVVRIWYRTTNDSPLCR